MNAYANMHAPALFDAAAVRAHATMLHERAKGINGVLVLAPFGEGSAAIDHKTGKTGRKLNFPCEKFEIGDVERMVESAMAFEGHEHANVYIPLHIMRHGLPPGQRGGLADIVGVFGLVADMDADTGKTGAMPVAPALVCYRVQSGEFPAPHPLGQALPARGRGAIG
jgi:hypothetical protein